jgi:uncharacterized protein YbjT (DUF2867 family)
VILLTGATGYVGGRLLAELERLGRPVRALARTPEKLEGRAAETTEVAAGDVTDRASLDRALDGVEAAYYLVHSLDSGAFGDEDRKAAETFAAAAAAAGLERIVYLGGIGRGEDLSRHLASRQEVGRLLRESPTPTVELRASIVIGDGSVSFDALRLLVERLPAALLPSWVRTPSQPIAVDDVVDYLVQALDTPLEASEVVEIGGADAVPYLEIIDEIARQTGKTRLFVPVPTPEPPIKLDDLPLDGLAPERVAVVARLVDSLRFDTSVQSDRAARLFPSIRPRGLQEAVAAALA